MNWNLKQFDDKDVIMTGENRDMTSTREFLEKHAHAKSYRHVFVEVGSKTSVYEQLGKPDLKDTIIIKAPGVPGQKMAVPFITSAGLFFELTKQLGATVIGVTGTKGKTTTASLVQAMLIAGHKPAVLCGNIGSSFLPLLEDTTAQTIFVAELSSQMLEDLTASPHIGIITNLYHDHIDYHGSLENYYAAKHHLVAYMGPDDVFIYNQHVDLLKKWAEVSQSHSIGVSGKEPIDMSKTGLIGEHNQINAIMARTAALECGVSEVACQQALDTFQPIKHRLQPVATIAGITYVDDAIASQPEAAIAGITAITKQVGTVGCLLLGGQDRDYDFGELMRAVADANIPNLVLFPDTVQKMKAALPDSYHPDILETRDMNEAVKWARQQAPKNSVVLLCSGAPSYSIWKDFEEKGDLFQSAVQSLER